MLSLLSVLSAGNDPGRRRFVEAVRLLQVQTLPGERFEGESTHRAISTAGSPNIDYLMNPQRERKLRAGRRTETGTLPIHLNYQRAG
jgi:hypothetical protein